MNYILTGEVVSDGHPDKVADQISDAVLDLYLTHDKNAKVACEVFVQKGIVFVGGEVTSKVKKLDIEPTIRKVINDIGYNHSRFGFNGNSVGIINNIVKQSPEIHSAVTRDGKTSAGDQGVMYGYATNDTIQYINLHHYLARLYIQAIRNDIVGFKGFRPDVKSQVSVIYNQMGEPIEIDNVVVSASHEPEHDLDLVREKISETVNTVNKYILDDKTKSLLTKNTKYIFNHAGTFVNCGPAADTGLTGRKIVVDQLNSIVGGGAFSGKCPSKVDRSAAYFARFIAKNIVHHGLAKKVLIEVAYVIGKDEPVALNIVSNDESSLFSEKLKSKIKQEYSFSVSNIIEKLDLLKPIYLNTAKYGHYGYNEYSWEKIDKLFLEKTIYS
ncbi:MAG: methionine adenosyltransferase [bacterium]